MKQPDLLEYQDEDRFVRREPDTLADQFIGRILFALSLVLVLVLMLGVEARFPEHLKLGLSEASSTAN